MVGGASGWVQWTWRWGLFQPTCFMRHAPARAIRVQVATSRSVQDVTYYVTFRASNPKRHGSAALQDAGAFPGHAKRMHARSASRKVCVITQTFWHDFVVSGGEDVAAPLWRLPAKQTRAGRPCHATFLGGTSLPRDPHGRDALGSQFLQSLFGACRTWGLGLGVRFCSRERAGLNCFIAQHLP